MAVYNTYDTIGLREDLQNTVWDVSPSDTPFVSSIAKIKAKGTLHEWLTDELRAPKKNAKIQGTVAGTAVQVPAKRLGNYTQILEEVAKVSDTNDSVDGAGDVNKMDYQIVKKSMELKTDIEYLALKNGAKVGGDNSTAAESGGIETDLYTNVDAGAGATEATGNFVDERSGGTGRTFIEAQIKNVMQKCFNAGGKPTKMFLAADLMDTFGTFTGNRTMNVDATKGAVEAAIDIYVSNYGTIVAEPSRIVNATSALILDTSLFKLAVLREFKEKELGTVGDFEATTITTEVSLVSSNQKGSGAVYDVTA